MKKFIKEIYPYVIIIGIVILIRSFIITPVVVSGDSMYPNYKDNEVLLLSKLSDDIERFDVVVINNDDKIIKRIIGLPGDTVEYKDNVLYINGEKVKEDYKHGETYDFDVSEISKYEKIPKGYYLVLGDNREVSADSRVYGLFSEDKIDGKVVVRIWPINRIGLID